MSDEKYTIGEVLFVVPKVTNLMNILVMRVVEVVTINSISGNSTKYFVESAQKSADRPDKYYLQDDWLVYRDIEDLTTALYFKAKQKIDNLAVTLLKETEQWDEAKVQNK